MKSDYWDALAPSFLEDVFDPVASDREGMILAAMRRVASKKARAAVATAQAANPSSSSIDKNKKRTWDLLSMS